ncbi:MAG TPA: hypothetical protein VFV50_16300 [Bdellovibrionales bacterium]|nr:hypothetical protein [Bdellovibrionales bacterium]
MSSYRWRLRASLVLPTVALLAAACTRSSESPVVAKVGRFQITEKDLEYKERLIQYYYPQSETGKALSALTKSYVNAQILENNGRVMNEEALQAESDRIDKNTKDPISLAEVKDIFGSDTAAYRRVFVLPTLADRLISFELFPEIQKKDPTAARLIESLLARLEKGLGLAGLCSGDGLQYSTLLAHASTGPLPSDALTRFPELGSSAKLGKTELAKIRSALEADGIPWQPAFMDGFKPLAKAGAKLKVQVLDGGAFIDLYVSGSLPMRRKRIEELERCRAPRIAFESWRDSAARNVQIEHDEN